MSSPIASTLPLKVPPSSILLPATVAATVLFDQQRGDAHGIAGDADRAIEHVVGRRLGRIGTAGHRNDPQTAVRVVERHHQVLAQSVADRRQALILADRFEGIDDQHRGGIRDRRRRPAEEERTERHDDDRDGDTGGDETSGTVRATSVGPRPHVAYAVDVHRLVDVLEGTAPEVADRHVDAVAHLFVDRGRDAYAARRRQTFEPRCDVDAVAEQVVAVDDDVAEIDAHAELHAAVLGHVLVCFRNEVLNGERAAHGLDGACELGDEAVAGSAEDAALMVADGLADDVAVGRQRADGSFLVLAHQPAVVGDIRRKNGGELAWRGVSYGPPRLVSAFM